MNWIAYLPSSSLAAPCTVASSGGCSPIRCRAWCSVIPDRSMTHSTICSHTPSVPISVSSDRSLSSISISATSRRLVHCTSVRYPPDESVDDCSSSTTPAIDGCPSTVCTRQCTPILSNSSSKDSDHTSQQSSTISLGCPGSTPHVGAHWRLIVLATSSM